MSRRSWARRFLVVLLLDDRPPVAPRPERVGFRFVVATVLPTLVAAPGRGREHRRRLRNHPPARCSVDRESARPFPRGGRGKGRGRWPANLRMMTVSRSSEGCWRVRREGSIPAEKAPRDGNQDARRGAFMSGLCLGFVWALSGLCLGSRRSRVRRSAHGDLTVGMVGAVRSRVSWRTRSRLSSRILAKQPAIRSMSSTPLGPTNGERLRPSTMPPA